MNLSWFFLLMIGTEKTSTEAIVDHAAVIVDHTEVSHSTLGEAAAAPG